MLPERRICSECKKEFMVGGRGNPKRSQRFCSRHCNMLQQSPRFTGSNAPRPKKYKETLHNKAWLEQKYLVEELSFSEISKLIGSSKQVVQWALNKHGISARDNITAKKMLYDRIGRKEVTQAELIQAYGGKCKCCGETETAFLTLDHIGGGGSEHRRSFEGNHVRKMRQELKAGGWPTDKYRLLCMNCNFATKHGKTCPHQLK